MIYTEQCVLKQGKDETLDNLKEGVIIVDPKEKKICFYNKAATLLRSNLSDSLSIRDEKVKPSYTNFAKEHHLKQFAVLDESLFDK